MKQQYFLKIVFSCALLSLFGLACATDGGGDVSLAPELSEDSFAASANPAESGDEVLFFIAYEDHDGDLAEGRLNLLLTDADGFDTTIELDDPDKDNANKIRISGTTAGTISFVLIAEDEYDDGEFTLTVYDHAGHKSNEASMFLDVNPPLTQ